MKPTLPKRIASVLHSTRMRFARPDAFMYKASGVVHVGANTGQERRAYERAGLPVLWIEPIPEVFEKLLHNIEKYPNQRALKALVTDRDDKVYSFNVANNQGASSSILDFKEHDDIWPDVRFTKTLELTGVTLKTLFERERIDTSSYDALVMDTQGTELLVLKGCGSLLDSIRFVKTEVPDFEAYAGCCQLDEMQAFLIGHGFRESARTVFATHTGGGNYYDVTFERS